MRKFATIGIIIVLFAIILTNCREKYSYEQTELEAVVIGCEEGTYHLDASYVAIANMYLAHENYGMWNMYLSLANTNGAYDYNVTIDIGGKNYTVIRKQQYEVGQYITVTMVNTYNMDSQLVNTECK